MLWTTDEEIGSTTSRALIETEAAKSDAVLVFEPSLPGGALKTSRKGVGQFEMIARGVSAHAGLDPGKGVSAIRELARQIIAIDDLQDPASGVTLTVGVVSGGTRANVVPAEARATIDARAVTRADADRVQRVDARAAAADRRRQRAGDRRIRSPAARADAGRRRAVRAGQGGGRRHRRRRWKRAAPAAAPTATSPRRWACRRSMDSAPSATARTRCTSTSRSTRLFLGLQQSQVYFSGWCGSRESAFALRASARQALAAVNTVTLRASARRLPARASRSPSARTCSRTAARTCATISGYSRCSIAMK